MSFYLPNQTPEDIEAIHKRIDRLVEARLVTGSWTAKEIKDYRDQLEAKYLD